MRHDIKAVQEHHRHGRIGRRVEKGRLTLHRLTKPDTCVETERIADQGKGIMAVGNDSMAKENLVSRR